MDENFGDGVGNKIANLIKNPLDLAAKGKFLHLHYKVSDVKEDRMESEYHWHHFLAKMQKPESGVKRLLYEALVTPFQEKMQIDEFAKIHDREVWVDRGYGTILMSDKIGETRVFDNGKFTKERQATLGNWEALITALKAIK
jgi:hypothetical protein